MYEEDWFMRQIKMIGEGFAIILQKKLSASELGELKLTDGQTVSREELLLDYLKDADYQQAFLLVNSLKYKLSVMDFNIVSEWFIKHLDSLPENPEKGLTAETIKGYQEKLQDLL